jgi:putative drug exporter of the RND superfamily
MIESDESVEESKTVRRGRIAAVLDRLGRICARRRWTTVLGVVALVAVLTPASAQLGAAFVDDFEVPGVDSQEAADLLAERFPEAGGDVVQVVVTGEGDSSDSRGRVDRESARAALDTMADRVRELPEVANAAPVQISPDGLVAFTTVQYKEPADELPDGTLDDLEAAVGPVADAGLEPNYRGSLVDLQGERSTPVGELVGIVAALFILTWLFRSFWATVVTLAAALLGVVVGTTVLAFVSAFVDVPTVAPTLVVMLGLGAGIDYALFMVARFRDRLRLGDDVVTAAGAANRTTGVAVAVAGIIVVISISGLFVVGIPFIGRMGMAAGLVVAISAAGAVTVVPALLSFAGHRVLPRDERTGGTPSEHDGRLARTLAVAMTRRPWLSGSLATVALVAMATPTLWLDLGQPDDGNAAENSTQRVAYDQLAAGFGPGMNGPLLVAVELPDGLDQPARDGLLQRLSEEFVKTENVETVTEPQLNPTGDAAVLTVVPTSAPQDQATSTLVTALRDQAIPAALADAPPATSAFVGGNTATFDDLAERVADRLWVLILTVVLLSLVLLTITFRSIWLPLVSAVFNLLAIGAAYGVVTLAFQTRTGAELLGVQEQPIISFVPMLMFAILFGLSMDYNVFLLSRVRERWLAGDGAHTAVVSAIGQTAGVIGAAGTIMGLVFLGFVLEDESQIKMIGLGLATAVLVDVTLVRLVLTPAVLSLLDERAWWLPKPLDRVLPHLDPVEH